MALLYYDPKSLVCLPTSRIVKQWLLGPSKSTGFVCTYEKILPFWDGSLLRCRESWASKRLFNLPPQFSRLGTRGPASFYVFCVVVCAFCMYLGGGSGY